MATYLSVTGKGGYSTGSWSGEIAQCTWTLIVDTNDPTSTSVVNAGIPEFDFDDTASTGTWASGTFTQGFGGVVDDVAQTAIASAVTTWFNAVDEWQVQSFSWQSIAMSLWQYDAVPPTSWGQVMETSVYTLDIPVAGDITTGAMPPQNAVCLSHYTPGSGGRNRGRVFLPFHMGLSGATQLLTGINVAALGAAEVALLEAFTAIEIDGGASFINPAVVSRVHQSWSSITNVRVGDEVDTQRRRRNGRAEVYESYPVNA